VSIAAAITRLPAGTPSRTAGAAAAAFPADERRWEAVLQGGRVPEHLQRDAGFLRYLCRQLEAAAVNTVFQTARRTVPAEGLFSGGLAGSMFQGMADEEYSRLIAARGGFGLGDALFAQMMPPAAAAGTPVAGGADPDRRAQDTDPQWFGYDELERIAALRRSRCRGEVR
jgi:Rod binding domain-containing protein